MTDAYRPGYNARYHRFKRHLATKAAPGMSDAQEAVEYQRVRRSAEGRRAHELLKSYVVPPGPRSISKHARDLMEFGVPAGAIKHTPIGRATGAWDENLHPRDANGEFTNK